MLESGTNSTPSRPTDTTESHDQPLSRPEERKTKKDEEKIYPVDPRMRGWTPESELPPPTKES
jgi:hypothetical protein